MLCCADVGCTRESTTYSTYKVTSIGYILCDPDLRIIEGKHIDVSDSGGELYSLVEDMKIQQALWCGFGFYFDISRITHTLHAQQLRALLPNNRLPLKRSSVHQSGYLDLLNYVKELTSGEYKKTSLVNVIASVSSLERFFMEYQRFLINYCNSAPRELKLHTPLCDAFAVYYLLKFWGWRNG